LFRTVAGESEIEYLYNGFFKVEFFWAEAKTLLRTPLADSPVALN
jgi:hypothetical protein